MCGIWGDVWHLGRFRGDVWYLGRFRVDVWHLGRFRGDVFWALQGRCVALRAL